MPVKQREQVVDMGDGSVEKAFDLQVQGPELNPRAHQKCEAWWSRLVITLMEKLTVPGPNGHCSLGGEL